MSNTHVGAHPMIPRFIRLFSVPIFLGWIAIVVIANIIVPQLEVVGEAHAVSLAPNDAPSLQAMQRIGKDFHEFDSNMYPKETAAFISLPTFPLGVDPARLQRVVNAMTRFGLLPKGTTFNVSSMIIGG